MTSLFRPITAAFCLVLLPLIAQSGFADDPDTQRISGTTMGTITYQVTIASTPRNFDREQVAASIRAELDNVNDMMSTYKPDSEVSRFNSSESTDWFSVSKDTATVVKRALELSEQTEGAFDITVGPLVNAWNFGPGKSEKFELPEQSVIERLLSTTGYQNLEVRDDPPAIKKKDPKVQIDLSAIAKGYAVDQVSRALFRLKLDRFLVEIGGEVYASKTKKDGSAWRVGILRPVEVGQSFERVARLENRAMATSGDYRNFEVVDGKRYSHTIDPRTGWPVKHLSLASASVVAKDCMTADAYATAVLVLGENKGYALSERAGFELFTYKRGPDLYTERQTDSFPIESKDASENAPGAVGLWKIFLAGVVVFGLAIAGMAIGVIISDRRIKGSCGGLANLKNDQGGVSCSICSTPSDACKDLREAKSRMAAKPQSQDV